MDKPKAQMVIFISARADVPSLIARDGNKPRMAGLTEIKDFILAAVLQDKILSCSNKAEGSYISVWDSKQLAAVRNYMDARKVEQE